MKSIQIMIVILLFPFSILAQQSSINSGSPYSAFGFGKLQNATFGQNEALAGTGIGLRPTAFVNAINPAALNSVKQPITMIFNTGFRMLIRRFDDGETGVNQRDGQLTNMNIWVRFNQKWAGTLGVTPYSKVGYGFFANRYSETVGGAYSVQYSGSGGLSRVYLGNAFEIVKGLNVGANLNLIFGSISRTESFIGNDLIADFNYESKVHLRDFNVDFGVQYEVPVFEKYTIVVGATYVPKANFFSKESTTISSPRSGVIEDSDSKTGLYATPEKIGLGFSVGAKKWSFATDVVFEKWNDITFSTNDTESVNTLKFSTGLEIAPFIKNYNSYERTVLFRGGFTVQNNYLQINGVNFIDWTVSAGLGIPMGKKVNHLNLTYSFAKTGSAEKNLFRETTHRLSLNVSLRDIWFVKREFQ